MTEGNGEVKSFIPVVAGFIPITLTRILGTNPGNFCCLLIQTLNKTLPQELFYCGSLQVLHIQGRWRSTQQT